ATRVDHIELPGDAAGRHQVTASVRCRDHGCRRPRAGQVAGSAALARPEQRAREKRMQLEVVSGPADGYPEPAAAVAVHYRQLLVVKRPQQTDQERGKVRVLLSQLLRSG